MEVLKFKDRKLFNFHRTSIHILVCFILIELTLGVDNLSRFNGLSINKLTKETLTFLSNIDGFDSNNVCKSLTRTDVQMRLSNLKSIISNTCMEPSFCRLALRPNGKVYAASNSAFNTFLSIVEVDNRHLLHDGSLLGASYIKFLLYDKYLCIDPNQNNLVALKVKGKECLWFMRSGRISSAMYRHIRLVVERKQHTCNIKLAASNPRTYEPMEAVAVERSRCSPELHVEKAYSSDLYKLNSQCVKLTNSDKQPRVHHANSFNQASSLIRSQTLLDSYKISTITVISNTPSTTTAATLQPTTTPLNPFLKRLCQQFMVENAMSRKLSHQMAYDYYDYKDDNFKLCATYLKSFNHTTSHSFNSTGWNDEVLTNEAQYPVQMKFNISNQTTSIPSITNKYKKCYALRNTSQYRSCIATYYRCFKFREDPQKLKSCRKKFNILVPTKSNASN